ncbi:ATP-binding protein [Tomitella biformata]|uniref:ATP-binding protein n=1 Tax=Tomitella biformata TaxID=630403 RepID=UPI000463B222|nr:ATP-binding protein [Tomitella biformata]
MQRGRLRVYLGAAPGVGKTFAMLDEGHRRLGRGADVVIGLVETHGRPHTAELIDGLEVVPRRPVPYRGNTYQELDLAAVLARDPDVALIDELAHSNIGDLTHAKRWQDIEDLLDAGIDVITTVNIQHIESLTDVAEAITGVRQQETVPERIVRAADAIELVDMSPQALRRRMAHGNIYSGEKADAALAQYFREGNLTALRELALLWLADRVDEGLEHYRRLQGIDATWAARERIVVAITGGPESAALMRRAVRISSRASGGVWMALYVARRDGLAGVSPGQLHQLRTLAEELGGSFHTVVGDETAAAVLDFARAEDATQVLIGASRRGRAASALRPGIGELLIAQSGDIDIHIVTHKYAGRRARLPRRANLLGRRRLIAGYACGVLAPIAVSALLWAIDAEQGLPTDSMALMAVVVGVALIGGLIPAVLAALLSGVLLNLLFAPPIWTLDIANSSSAVAIALFVGVAVAVATVVDHAAGETARARKARAEADALTVLSHGLLHAGGSLDQLLSGACEMFAASGAAIVRTDGEVLASHGHPPAPPRLADTTAAVDADTTLILRGPALDASDRRLLNAYAIHAAVLADRHRAGLADIERARLAETDRTRTALLAAVSHDLRSPLAAVKAAASSLRNTEITWSPADEAELLATVEDSADRLGALIANLLDMSRIQLGAVTPSLADLGLGSAIRWTLSAIPGAERIAVRVADERLTVRANAGLLDRVLANLCENALGHTPADTPIAIDAVHVGHRVQVRVIDHGPGIAEAQHAALFVPFQRLGDVPAGDGVGLGLAVARGLTEAMGGSLTAEDTPGGGLTLILELAAGKVAL